jgi:hypothetical protein
MAGDITFALLVDTADNGTFTTDIFDLAMASGITATRGRDQARSISPSRAGDLQVEVDEDALPHIVKGRLIRLRATDFVGAKNLWTGLITSWERHVRFNVVTATIHALGVLSRLPRTDVSTALYASIRTDIALGHLLDAVGFPAADRVFDVGQTTMDWWWLDGEDPFSALEAIRSAEGPNSVIYEDADGKIVFKNRYARTTESRSTVVQDTFSTTASPYISNLAEPTDALQNKINVCKLTVRQRTAKTLGVIWTLGSTLILAPNESRKFEVRGTGNDPFIAAVCTSPTDYTVTVGSLSSVAFDRTSGASATLTVTAGTSGATVENLQVRAQLVSVDREMAVINSVGAPTAGDEQRTYQLPTRSEIPLIVAQDFCDAVGLFYGTGREQLIPLSVLNVTDNDSDAQLRREVSDLIHVTATAHGINDDYFIEQITQKVEPGGILRTEFGCEFAGESGWFILDGSLLDGPDGLAA